VGHEQDGQVAFRADAVELVVQHVPGHRVQRAERLVHQQHVGVLGQRTGQRDPLPHTAGKLVRSLGAEPAQVHRLEQFLGALTALGLSDATSTQRQLHVARRREPGEQRGLLEHEGHLPARGRHLAGRGLLQPGDQRKQRGLTAARGADEAGEFAGRHLERYLVERADGRAAPPEHLGYAGQPDGRLYRPDRGCCLAISNRHPIHLPSRN
jgi:hypothetical protein